MFKSISETLQQLLFLVRDTHENKVNIEKLEEKVQQLTKKVEVLAFEIERTREHERHEREKLAMRVQHAHEKSVLQVDSILARFENRLQPPPK